MSDQNVTLSKEKCDHSVNVENGVMTYSNDIECIGECSEGCCDYFRCKVCNHRFKVEHS
jgi:hypothetical protein